MEKSKKTTVLQIDENSYIRLDKYSWELVIKTKKTKLVKNKKTGEVKEVAVKDKRYYPNLKLALQHYVDFKMREDSVNLKSISEILEVLKRIEDKIEAFKSIHIKNTELLNLH